MLKTTATQYYTDIELMAWADRESQHIDVCKLTVADIATATVFVRTRRLLQRVAALDTNTRDD
jgi:hypothetical protein